MLYFKRTMTFKAALCLLGCAVLAPTSVFAAIITVGATGTYPDLNTAFNNATGGDIILLEAVGTYTLTSELVITKAKSPLRIQGPFNNNERPDQIIIEGPAGTPAITVETDAQVTLRHLSITGGTVGVQVMMGASCIMDRVYINGTGNEGMTVSDANLVHITSSIFTGCGGAGLLINSGPVNITQSTFIDNTGLAIDLQGGTCMASGSFFYNNNGGPGTVQVDGAVAGVELDWFGIPGGGTVGATVVAPPLEDLGAVTYATEFADPENLVFLTGSPWRGQVRQAFQTGVASGTFTSAAPLGRDFVFRIRNTTDAQLGAHEHGAVAGGLSWVDCDIYQFGQPLQPIVGSAEEYAAAGEIQIDITVGGLGADLTNATLYVVPQGGALGAVRRYVPIPITVGPPGFEYFGTATFLIEGDHYVTFETETILLDGLAELALQIPGDINNDFPAGGDEFSTTSAAQIEPAAEAGRTFIIDTYAPTIAVTGSGRAFEYVASTNLDPPTGGLGAEPLLVPWSAASDPYPSSTGLLAGAQAGLDPHVFFNNQMALFDFTIQVTFTDAALPRDNGAGVNITPARAGFGAAGAVGGPYIGPDINNVALVHPDIAGVDPRGLGWWEGVKPVAVDGATSLAINYTGGGDTLTVQWVFTGVPTDFTLGTGFWETVAQFGAQDLAGNVMGANPSNDPLIQEILPFHIWQLAGVQGALRDGLGGQATNSPVISWGVQRFNGVVPSNTDNAYPIAQYAVYGRAVGQDPYSVGWALAGGREWSDWIASPRIDKFTIFDSVAGTRLGDITANPGQYMIVVRTADEAGNIVDRSTYPGLGTLNLGNLPFGFVADTWNNGGLSISLDTRVQPVFWHNFTNGLNLRGVDAGEKTFGAATRIPLTAPEDCVQRVEAGFSITMDLPDSADTSNAGVAFQLLEDGVVVATGTIDGAANNSKVFLVIPQDLFGGTPGVNVDAAPNPLDFLNLSPDVCGPVRERLGDDGNDGPESPHRKRDVKYVLRAATGYPDPVSGLPVFDQSPTSVEFVVTPGSGGSKASEQSIKTFKRD